MDDILRHFELSDGLPKAGLIFFSTSLPLTNTRWVRSIVCSGQLINLGKTEFEKIGNAKIWTQGRWPRSKNDPPPLLPWFNSFSFALLLQRISMTTMARQSIRPKFLTSAGLDPSTSSSGWRSCSTKGRKTGRQLALAACRLVFAISF